MGFFDKAAKSHLILFIAASAIILAIPAYLHEVQYRRTRTEIKSDEQLIVLLDREFVRAEDYFYKVVADPTLVDRAEAQLTLAVAAINRGDSATPLVRSLTKKLDVLRLAVPAKRKRDNMAGLVGYFADTLMPFSSLEANEVLIFWSYGQLTERLVWNGIQWILRPKPTSSELLLLLALLPSPIDILASEPNMPEVTPNSDIAGLTAYRSTELRAFIARHQTEIAKRKEAFQIEESEVEVPTLGIDVGIGYLFAGFPIFACAVTWAMRALIYKARKHFDSGGLKISTSERDAAWVGLATRRDSPWYDMALFNPLFLGWPSIVALAVSAFILLEPLPPFGDLIPLGHPFWVIFGIELVATILTIVQAFLVWKCLSEFGLHAGGCNQPIQGKTDSAPASP